MNTCSLCGLKFNSYGDFHEHTTLGHNNKSLESNARALKTHSSGRSDLSKRIYPGPMAKEVKDKAVAKGEARLGKGAFYG